MTTCIPSGRWPVGLREPAHLLAGLPYLLGFHPGPSVVLLGHGLPDGTHIGLILRADLPAGTDHTRQARAAAARFVSRRHRGVTVAIIGGRRRPGGPPPYEDFVRQTTEAFAEADLPVLHALWAAELAEGAPWACYGESCTGALPDPRTTILAATMTEKGTVVFDSREELEGLLAPRSPEAVHRRAAELSRLEDVPWPEQSRVADAASELREAFLRLRRGDGPLTDAEAIRLACALRLPEIRDSCLAMAVPPRTRSAREAEHLWLTLVRELPPPDRAEAAALLGYTAYMRGEGAFAGMALENALQANPNHVLADLLTKVLDHGVPPEDLLGLARAADPDGIAGFGLEEPPP